MEGFIIGHFKRISQLKIFFFLINKVLYILYTQTLLAVDFRIEKSSRDSSLCPLVLYCALIKPPFCMKKKQKQKGEKKKKGGKRIW